MEETPDIRDAIPLFILGAAKAGTSTVYSALQSSTDIHVPEVKEPLFFEMEFQKGISYYFDKYFPDYAGEKIFVDARPSNMFLPFVPGRIAASFKQPLGLIILRDPVQRAYSHWWMRYSRGRERLSFEEAMRYNMDNPEIDLTDEVEAERTWLSMPRQGGLGAPPLRVYYEMGLYDRQVACCFTALGRQNIHVMTLESLMADPQHELDRISRFLESRAGVSISFSPDSLVHENKALPAVEARLRGNRVVRKMRSAVPAKLRKHILRYVSRMPSPERPRLDEKTRANLSAVYSDSVHNLRSIVPDLEISWRI